MENMYILTLAVLNYPESVVFEFLLINPWHSEQFCIPTHWFLNLLSNQASADTRLIITLDYLNIM